MPDSEQQLRVLYVSHNYPQAVRPWAGIFITREAQFLRKYGIEPFFLVPRPWAPWPVHLFPKWRAYGPTNRLIPQDGLQIRRVNYLRPPGSWFLKHESAAMTLAARPVAREWHREVRFRVVFGIDMSADARTAVSIGKMLGLPVATLAIGSDIMRRPNEDPALRKQLETTLENVDLPVGVSRMVCAALVETGKCRREPFCVYLGRDAERYCVADDKASLRRSLGWRPDAIVGVYVGRLEHPKGMDELAEAARALLPQYARLKFVCIGEGPARGVLTQVATEVGRPDAMELTGTLPPEEVPKYLQASDFLVFPSHSEGLPQAVLEAMNCGLPVVATDVGGTSEAVVDGETGLLIDAKDTQQLASAVTRMVADETFRLEAGRKGLARAREVFDADKNAEGLAEALRSLSERPPTR